MKAVKKWVMVSFGGLVFVIGAILFPLPIPLGLLLMIVGLSMMATHPAVLTFLRRFRNRFPAVSKKLKQVTPHMPGALKRFIKSTEMPKKPRKPLLRRAGERAKTQASNLAASMKRPATGPTANEAGE